jgi:ferric-dicitrate binding protein FerR (iron transport regulator)
MKRTCHECEKEFEATNYRVLYCDMCKDDHRKRVAREACKRWREKNTEYKAEYKKAYKELLKSTKPTPYLQNTNNIETLRAKRKQQEIMRSYYGL